MRKITKYLQSWITVYTEQNVFQEENNYFILINLGNLSLYKKGKDFDLKCWVKLHYDESLPSLFNKFGGHSIQQKKILCTVQGGPREEKYWEILKYFLIESFYIYSHLLKKLELTKLCRKKL